MQLLHEILIKYILCEKSPMSRYLNVAPPRSVALSLINEQHISGFG